MSAATATPALRGRDDVLGAFDGFRQHLDEHHDRRERLIKSSRDATNLSKKVIFLLHRLMTEDTSDPRKAARRGHEKLKEVQQIYAGMADKGELEGDRFWRYQHQVSPGLQEYIEALSYAHYLEHETLISFEEVQRSLCREDGTPYFPLTTSDYLLGISDLTGELMRFAISSISRRGGRTKAAEICAFVRDCKAGMPLSPSNQKALIRLTPYVRELHKKQAVTSQSLQKIEDAAYTIAVRFSEYDVPPEMMEDIVSSTVANFSADPRDSRAGRGRRDDYDDEGRDEYD
ncbi:Translin [Schizophyllum commune H4-8]|uniref:Translin n=1 Tax=Schizophyllum commune (strain H4-8 / FGSC 9210) TaxID=578458 RepID=UPI0021600F46|nr:Translin [Schizophyllum commune H4-8]KAI5898601.1 Translin [Schizophyllum commune H4-8]